MAQSYGNLEGDTPVNSGGSDMQPGDVARPAHVERVRRSRRFRYAFAGIVSLGLVIGACEGDNLFSGDTESARPRIISVSLSQAARAGDTLAVTVGAFGPRFIQSITISLSGAVAGDTTITIDPPTATATGTFKLELPALLQDTLLTVKMTARDRAGATSEPLTRVLKASAPPAIVAVDRADSVRLGQPFELRIRAIGLRKVTRILVGLRGAVNRDTTVTIAIPANDVTQSVSFNIPAVVGDTVLTVLMAAVDDQNQQGNTAAFTLPVGISPPTVTIVQAPDSAQAGRTLDLRLNATGSRPINRFNIQLRGAVDEDLTVQVTPSSTNTTKDVAIPLPDSTRDTLLVVRVTATDDANIVSQIVTRTIRVRDVSAPSVTASLTQGTAGAGSSVSVRVSASDNVSIARIGFIVYNANGVRIDSVFAQVPSGRAKDTTFTYTVSGSLTPTTLIFQGLAEDRQGMRGLSAQVSLGVVDLIDPTVTILSPVDNATFPLSDSVLVRARVADASRIESVTFSGIAIRNDSLTGSEVVTKFTSKTIQFPQAPQTIAPLDTTVVRYLNPVPNDSISEIVAIVVEATDTEGNVGVDTTFISVGGPRVEIRTPTSGTTILAGSTLPVRLFARDAASGIDSLRLDVTGIAGANPSVIVYRNLAAPDSVIRDTLVVLPAGVTGTLTLNATAWNRRGILGRAASPVVLTVSSTAVADNQKPQVRVEYLTSPTRIELNDSIAVRVSARDVGSAGLKRIGITAMLQRSDGVLVRDTVARDTVFPSSRTGDLEKVFYIKPSMFQLTDTTHMPVDLTLQVHAFAKDTVGNCGAAVRTTFETLNCQGVILRPTNGGPATDSFYIAQGVTGAAISAKLVIGRTVRLTAANGRIADAVVDTLRRRLYLSDIQNSKIEVLNMDSIKFFPAPVSVGSEPWGLFIDNSGDTLLVANSGGTNISFVAIDDPGNFPTTINEEAQKRLLTPNNVLFDVNIVLDNSLFRYLVNFHDYSDRPQFIAQDSMGRLLYSTKPTSAASQGTIRVVSRGELDGLAGVDTAEVRILFNNAAFTPSANVVGIANIDSIRVVSGGSAADDRVILYDHRLGHPGIVIQCGPLEVRAAVTCLDGLGSDIVDVAGAWDDDRIGLSDTTFIAASGTRNRIAFGEGATGPQGRIMMWSARDSTVSSDVSVQDLVNNASERVLGLGLNRNGEMGVARGSVQAYFFDRNLRQQGIYSDQVTGGTGGAAMHPHHVDILGSNDSTLSFIATPNRSIRIVDTFHFNLRGEIFLRDNVSGPVRASMPLAGENPIGMLPSNPEYILFKLYAVTDVGGVVVVNVRRRDLSP